MTGDTLPCIQPRRAYDLAANTSTRIDGPGKLRKSVCARDARIIGMETPRPGVPGPGE